MQIGHLCPDEILDLELDTNTAYGAKVEPSSL